jgi:hypothetical protein
MAVEPGHSPQQEANRCFLLFVWEHFHVGQTGGVIHCHVSLFITSTTRRTQTPIASDPVADPLKACEPFDIDMDHVAWLRPLVAAHGFSGLQVF